MTIVECIVFMTFLVYAFNNCTPTGCFLVGAVIIAYGEIVRYQRKKQNEKVHPSKKNIH